MSENVFIRGIQLLTGLRHAIERFRSNTSQTLETAKRQGKDAITWVQGREQHWKKQVQLAEQELQQARRALDACLRSGTPKNPPNCRGAASRVELAHLRLRAATDEHTTARKWRQQVEAAYARYDKQAHALNRMLNGEVVKATNHLSALHAQLERYMQTRSESSGSTMNIAPATVKAQPPPSGPSFDPAVATGAALGVAGLAASVAHQAGADASAPTAPDDAGTSESQPAPRRDYDARFPDLPFQDRAGRSLVLRTHVDRSQVYLRVYHPHADNSLPDSVRTAPGEANLHLERGMHQLTGEVARIRLGDVRVQPSYQQAQIGTLLLDHTVKVAQAYNVSEVYGSAPDDQTTRDWYVRNGFSLRETDGRTFVYKTLRFT